MMGSSIVYIIIIAILFATSFFTKRRFGILGLALAAGSILSGFWLYDGGLVAGLFNIPNSPYTTAAVSSIIILLPSIAIILFYGGKYKTMVGRVVGSILFAVLAMAFLFEPLSHTFTFSGPETIVMNAITANRQIIISLGLVAAVVDVVLYGSKHAPEGHHGRRKH
jgi:hypothetical protein